MTVCQARIPSFCVLLIEQSQNSILTQLF